MKIGYSLANSEALFILLKLSEQLLQISGINCNCNPSNPLESSSVN